MGNNRLHLGLHRKIVTPAALARRLEPERRAGRRIVQCHGCFDIVHPGHVRYLHHARQLGDVLIVSLTADREISKGPDRPYIPHELRAENLAALEFVDWVVVDNQPTAVELLECTRPDIYVKGREYALTRDERFLREREVVERHGGKVVFHSGEVVFSSTRIIDALAPDSQLSEQRLRTLCTRHAIEAQRVSRTLDAFRGTPVLVIGDCVIEQNVHCDPAETPADATMLAVRALHESTALGGAAFLARAFRALGAEPQLLSPCTYEQRAGLERDLAQAGIRAHLTPGRPDIAERITYTAEESKLFRVNRGAYHPLDSAAQREAFAAVQDCVKSAAIVAWADQGYGAVTPELAETINSLAKSSGALVVALAPARRMNLEPLRGMDLFTCTERQLREIAADSTLGLPAVAATVARNWQADRLIVSLRRRGLLCFETHDQGRSIPPGERLPSEFIPTSNAVMVDTLGADEAQLAAAALALAHSRSLPLSAYIGAAAESLAASRYGLACATADELATSLLSRAELGPPSRFYTLEELAAREAQSAPADVPLQVAP